MRHSLLMRGIKDPLSDYYGGQAYRAAMLCRQDQAAFRESDAETVVRSGSLILRLLAL